MLNAVLLIAVIALTLIAGSAIDFSKFSSPESRAAPPAAAQSAIPDFEFRTFAGNTMRLSDYNDRVVVLNFWASWCAPCVAEFPLLLALARAMPDHVTLIAMSLDDDHKALNRFLKKHGGDYNTLANVIIALDPERAISQKTFSTFRLPETIIIAPGGIFHRKIVGYSEEWNDTKLKAELRALLP